MSKVSPNGPSSASAPRTARSQTKTIAFPGRFKFQSTSLPENRILGAPCGTAPIKCQQTLPERTKARQRGQRMAYRGRRRLARQPEPKTGKGKTIPRTGVFVRNQRKSVCTAVCTFGFRGQARLQCLRAVRLRPVFAYRRMRFYAPYAVALKGKALKKVQLRKEVHKVHTASLMSAQPYSLLAFRF